MEYTQSIRKLIFSVVIVLITTGSLLSQTDLLKIMGSIKDDSGRKLPGSEVVVYQDGQRIDTQEVDKNGKYSFELIGGHKYIFSFQRENYLSKKILIDLTQGLEFPEDDYLSVNPIEIFKEVEGFDSSILDDPIGILAYNTTTGEPEWDWDYTDRMKQRLENEFNRLAAIEENREKNKRAFDVADNFFREALKSENMARAAEIEEKKQEGEEHLSQREKEAEERREEVRSDIEQKVEYNEQNADEAEARARDRANDVVDAHAENENFKRNKEAQSKETRDINAEQIQTTKDGMENIDKSVDQEVPEMYKGKAEEHQDIIEYNQSVVDADKVRHKGHLDQRRIDANSSGYDASSEANGAYAGEYERNAGTPTLSLADEELPQGFHEYSYEIPNGTVIELTYREGDKIVRYKKVLMKTGTFYFRDNKSITASIFHRETTVIHD